MPRVYSGVNELHETICVRDSIFMFLHWEICVVLCVLLSTDFSSFNITNLFQKWLKVILRRAILDMVVLITTEEEVWHLPNRMRLTTRQSLLLQYYLLSINVCTFEVDIFIPHESFSLLSAICDCFLLSSVWKTVVRLEPDKFVLKN